MNAEGQPNMVNRKPTIFERYPRIILMVLLATVSVVLLFVTEWIAKGLTTNPPIYDTEGERIRLRAGTPNVDLLLELEGKTYRYRTDADGFVRPSRIHTDPDRTLTFLGGSTTECIHNSEDKRFPYLVGRLIEAETGLKINTLNRGGSGNHSLHSLNILINKILPLDPDMVILMHNINDLSILILEGTYWNHHPTRGLLLEEPIDIPSSLGRLFKAIRNDLFPNLYFRLHQFYQTIESTDEFASHRRQRITYDEEAIVQHFRTSLEIFIGTCRAADITPVLMTQANRFRTPDDPPIDQWLRDIEFSFGLERKPYIALYNRMNATIRSVAADHGVLLVDLDQAIDSTPEMLRDPIHFTDLGSETAAQAIAPRLITGLGLGSAESEVSSTEVSGIDPVRRETP